MKVLVSHRTGLSLLLVLALLQEYFSGFSSPTEEGSFFFCWFSPCSEGFSPDTPVFLPPEKPTFSNSNSSRRVRADVASSLNIVIKSFICCKEYSFIELTGVTVFVVS